MNNWVVILVVLIILAVAVIGLKLMFEINRNVKIGKEIREKLMERLEQLPMIKMLVKHDIDANEYLHNVPIMQVEKQLHNCSVCTVKQECRESLSKEEAVEDDYSFCPNDVDFNQLENSESVLKTAATNDAC